MRGEGRTSARVQEHRSGGSPGQRDDGIAMWDPVGGDESSTAPGAVSADLIADTVEALQARRNEYDHDALRGTIEPFPRHVRSQRRAGELRRD